MQAIEFEVMTETADVCQNLCVNLRHGHNFYCRARDK
jgi:hypothetical protein